MDTLRRIAPVLLARAHRHALRRPATPGSVPCALAHPIPWNQPSSGPSSNDAPETAAADRRHGFVLGRPNSAAIRAPCVLASLRLAVSGTTFPDGPLDGVLLDSEQRWNEIKRAVTEEEEAVRGLANRRPLGLASSSNREVIDHFLDLTGLEGAFAVTLSSEQVDRGRPSPR